MGAVHFDHDSTPIRLRNISSRGAQIDCRRGVPVGSELLLDLGEAGTIFAVVAWAVGDQVGLRFDAPFDLALLANSRPELATERWSPPAYLRDQLRASSPWADALGRLSLNELQSSLEGFLKR